MHFVEKKPNQKRLDFVEKLRPVQFTWDRRVLDNSDINNPINGKKRLGFIAQELNEIYPEAVGGNEDDEDHVMSVSKEALVPVLVKAVQELSAKVKALESAE